MKYPITENTYIFYLVDSLNGNDCLIDGGDFETVEAAKRYVMGLMSKEWKGPKIVAFKYQTSVFDIPFCGFTYSFEVSV